MENEFFVFCIRLVSGYFILALMLAGIDIFFHVSNNLTFELALELNLIFSLGCLVIILPATYFLEMFLDSKPGFLNDKKRLVLLLSGYVLMAFALKSYLVYHYSLSFDYFYTVVSINALFALIPLYALYLFMQVLANAFRNH